MKIGFNMSHEGAKAGFFDRPKVLAAMAERTSAYLNRFGGFVAKTAKRSMRPAGKKGATSVPGEPPRTRVGLIRKQLFYSYDAGSRSVVIGPVALNKPTGVPELMEYGGEVQTTQRPFRMVNGKAVFFGQPYTKTAIYKPRPYMAPAFAQGLARADTFWTRSVRAA